MEHVALRVDEIRAALVYIIIHSSLLFLFSSSLFLLLFFGNGTGRRLVYTRIFSTGGRKSPAQLLLFEREDKEGGGRCGGFLS